MASIAQEYSLFEIDRELDTLLDEIEEEIESRSEASAELMERVQQFCEAHGRKGGPHRALSSHDGGARAALPE